MSSDTAQGRDLGQRISSFIRQERPGTLIEYPLTSDEVTLLRRVVRALPTWGGWSHADQACVALHAVTIAAQAEVEVESFRAAFFQSLGRPPDHRLWEEQYGGAIELFLSREFGRQPSSGPYRYVGAVYRHAGITARGTGDFADFLRRVLDRSPAVHRQAYEAEVENLSDALIGPFLKTQAGFDFCRQTAAFLSEHRHLGRPLEWLESLSGYRRGFWRDFLPAFPGNVAPPGKTSPPQPRLFLDLEQGRLVIRFDASFVGRGAYFVEGRRVRHSELPVRGLQSRRYALTPVLSGPAMALRIERWWTPSVSPWALFRYSDGALAHVGQDGANGVEEVEPGEYLFVGSLEYRPDLPGDDFGALEAPEADGESECQIKRFQLEPGQAIEVLGIAAPSVGRTPGIAFARGGLPGNLFFGGLPSLLVSHWPAGNRFRLVCDAGHRLREQAVTSGASSVTLDLPCPSRGTIRVEYRGVDYAQRSLPSLSYVLLPREFSPQVLTSPVGPLDRARVRLPLLDGWRVAEPDGATARTVDEWEVTAGTTVWTPLIEGPEGFTAPVSIPIPVCRLEWGTSLSSKVFCTPDWRTHRSAPVLLRGPRWARADVAIAGEHARHVLVQAAVLKPRLDVADTSASGTWRGTVDSCLDRLQACRVPVGRVVVSLGASTLRQGLAWLQPGAWAEALDPFEPQRPATLPGDWYEIVEEASPELASGLLALLNTETTTTSELRLDALQIHAVALLPEAAGICLLACLFDDTKCDRSEDQLWSFWHRRAGSEDYALEQLCQWWRGESDEAPLRRLRWARWRQRVEEEQVARWMLRHPLDVVRKFRQAVLSNAPEQSPLAGQREHPGVFHGAALLYRALNQAPSETRNQLLVLAARAFGPGAQRPANGTGAPESLIVGSISRLLLAVARLEMGQAVSPAALDLLEQGILSVFGPAVRDLRQKAGYGPQATGEGVSLADILPPASTD